MAPEETPQTDRESVQAMEEKWLKFWEDEGVFRFDPTSGRPVFSIDTPPPTVSGRMHIGHAYSYNQMDFVARYKRMRGYEMFYPFGFDDNGLPTERYTEKAVGVKLQDVGRQEFIRLCLQETKKAEESMERSWRRIGMSCDWSIVYRTIDKPVVKVSQESFLHLYNEQRAYRAERPTVWCPDCATAIAQVEMEDKSLPSTFNDIAFDLVGEPALDGKLVERIEKDGKEVVTYRQGAEGRIVISTTRPELIPACVAIFVHPDDPRTQHLVGRKVRVPVSDAEVPVLTSDKVEKETGTGVVMNCTFGDLTDIDWWQENNLPLRIAIGPDGVMTEQAGAYAGEKVDQAREHILRDLESEARLLHQKRIEHNVNVHERCGTPIEFLVTKQWFVSYLDLKDAFLERGANVNWYPEYMRVRYDNWVKGLKWDWCISRQRYFGVPFPVWYCEGCEAPKVASLDELPVDPTVDKPAGKCDHCGGTAFRGESDVMDTWATSSLTPQIAIITAAERLGVPHARLMDIHEKPELKQLMPMSLRSQAHEIISFWAFNTVVKAHFHHGTIPWRDTMISGFVKLGKGKKMSKSKGEIVEPLQVIEDYSADALRYWSATGANLGEDIIWNPKDLTRAQRLVTKLRNVQTLIQRSVAGEKPADVAWDDLELADRWILSEYGQLVRQATESWDAYDYTRAIKDTENFLWHVLADHYLELVKARVYEGDAGARYTLYTLGLGLVKLLAPVICFASEDLYQEIYRRHEGAAAQRGADGSAEPLSANSVHVAPWPEAPEVDKTALEQGAHLRDVVAAVRNWKSQNKIPLNAAIPPLEVVAPPHAREALQRGEVDLKGTTKTEGLEFVGASDVHMVPVSVEPVQAKLGPKYRQAARAVAEAVRSVDPETVTAEGLTVTTPDGESYQLAADEYTLKERPTLHGAEVDALEVGDVTVLLRKP